ncbi:MAG TPA: SH3 domain-containing C40 family peptidase [Anaerolineales bacterium]|nr:SH3 domain-containing C40 family peptidase [Anaerolineales bacterium]HNS61508.1 SH3 domain-containing C40 family peptidase [Anaerolineales bacterium]
MQTILDDYAKTLDKRVTVFDVKVDSDSNGTLTLSGRVLHKSQLDEIHRIFPDVKLDTASVRILHTDANERVHVATNLTGLHEKPTFRVPLLSELPYGTELEVLEEEGKWVFVRQTDGYLGWAYRPYLGEGLAPASTHLVIAPVIELRAEPNAVSEVVTRLVSGTGVTILSGDEGEETRDGWSKVRANRVGWVESHHLRALDDISQSVDEKRVMLESDSQRMIGVPYLWGGSSGNGIDCSGFAQLLHRWIGIEIPRDADMQCNAAKPVEPPYELGDLIFFSEDDDKHITHVGMSLGGSRMIHSSRSHNGVYVDDLQVRKSLMDIFVGAGSYLR